MKLIKIILSYTLKFFHLLIAIIGLIGPIMTNDILALAFLFGLNMVILLCWVINDGVCFLSPIEQKLDGVDYKYSNGLKKTFFAVYLEKIFKNEAITLILITVIPILNIFLIIYKIINYKTICDVNMENKNIMSNQAL
jgi:hypothetical protein